MVLGKGLLDWVQSPVLGRKSFDRLDLMPLCLNGQQQARSDGFSAQQDGASSAHALLAPEAHAREAETLAPAVLACCAAAVAFVYDELRRSGSLVLPIGRVDLGDGVRIVFGGANLLSGDYWTFAARSADGSVEALEAAPPAGIVRHRCPLAVVNWSPQTDFPPEVTRSIARDVWPALTDAQLDDLEEALQAEGSTTPDHIVEIAESLGIPHVVTDVDGYGYREGTWLAEPDTPEPVSDPDVLALDLSLPVWIGLGVVAGIAFALALVARGDRELSAEKTD